MRRFHLLQEKIPYSTLPSSSNILNRISFARVKSNWQSLEKATEELTTGGNPAYIRTGHLQNTSSQRQPYHKQLVLRIPLAVKTSSHLWYQQQQRLVDLFH